MRAIVLTLDQGQTVPWHYHSTITDSFVCLRGPMVVETRAPRNNYVLNAGERCEVPPKTAHHVPGLNGGPCQFMVLQGIGVYDNMRVVVAETDRAARGPRAASKTARSGAVDSRFELRAGTASINASGQFFLPASCSAEYGLRYAAYVRAGR